MELEKARAIAEKLKSLLEPACEKVAIAGSIRRQRPFVRDVDIVLIPSNQGQLLYQLQQLGRIKSGKGKLIRIEPCKYGIPLDVYVATPETWATLLLIRTGSKASNIRLCILARDKGMKLHADGSGLFRIEAQGCEGIEVRIAGETEESIFQALGVPYKKPWERE